jgi:hypothetical protein
MTLMVSRTSPWWAAGHHSAHALLRCPRRDWVLCRRSADIDERCQLHVRSVTHFEFICAILSCSLTARATKAVSLVSPAYYADLACERGRCYLHKLLQGFSSSGGTATSGSDEAIMQEAVNLWHGGVQGAQLKNTMYYL